MTQLESRENAEAYIELAEEHLAKLAHYRTQAFGNDMIEEASKDTRAQLRFVPWPELEALYTTNALARRVIDRICDDGIKEGFGFEHLPEGLNEKECASFVEDDGVLESIARAAKMGRLYGSALWIPLTDDGPADTPFNLDKVTRLNGFEIIAAPDAYPDIRQYRYGSEEIFNPEFYLIIGGARVHRSRVIRFNGDKVPARIAYGLRGWHMSTLNPLYEDLRRLGTIRKYMEQLSHNISTSVLKIQGLGRALLAGGEQKAKAKQAVRELQSMVDNLHWLAIDGKDSFDVSDRPMSGFRDLDERAVEAFVMGTDYPREIATGETKQSLNQGENSGPVRVYYDIVRTWVGRTYTPGVNRYLDIRFKIQGVQAKTWALKWNPLWATSRSDDAAVRESNGRTDTLLVNGRILSPEIIAIKRYVEGNEGALHVTAEELAKYPVSATAPVPGVAPPTAPEHAPQADGAFGPGVQRDGLRVD